MEPPEKPEKLDKELKLNLKEINKDEKTEKKVIVVSVNEAPAEASKCAIPPVITPRVATPGSGGKGKRGASAPLTTTSDEDSDTPPSPRDSVSVQNTPRSSTETDSCTPTPRECTTSPSSVDNSLVDHDYENVSSPGGSSTASGPTYVRQPGFVQHAHEVTVQHAHEVTVSRPKHKKKKTALLSMRDGSLKKCEPSPPKSKPKRDPLPMRLRALPQSFWQQPNVSHHVPPGAAYPVLPPLSHKDAGEDVTGYHSDLEIRPVTPPDDKEKEQEKMRHLVSERKITVANTDLLFKLFEGVEKESKKSPISQFKRGRPRKVVPSSNKSFVTGEDPYLVECVTEKLFPQLSLEKTKSNYNNGTTSLQLVTLREGDRCITLPSLSVEQNYSQMLSELVMHI